PAASAAAILLFLLAIQAGALWIFTKGFLLTRTTLEGVAHCDRAPVETWQPPRPIDQVEAPLTRTEQDILQWQESLLKHAECTLPSTYDRAFVLIIDALRYDFIAPIERNDTTANPFFHDVFRLPPQKDRESRESNQHLSFLAHFLADAPTTTLQRLKGLTTGTLPTFIDAGSNFGGAEITEDNWISQLKRKLADSQASSNKLGFAGDDTWVTVFPSLFDPDWTFPYDSFNVEDLDSVDQGVKEKLLPLLESKNNDWRLLIGHTLGVDHVGHRLGTSHPRMRTKLEEMDDMVKVIIDNLPKDSLFVLLGDHGMDDKGDHGGDGELEVGSGLWMYARQDRARKGSNVEKIAADVLRGLNSGDIEPHVQFSPLRPSEQGHRSVAQIDLVPTMSLLMGLPIPFNNLGTVIPEVFLQQAVDAAQAKNRLLRALRVNAIQIHRYLNAYAAESRDLQPFEASIRHDWHQALLKDEIYARLLHQGASSEAVEHAELEASRAYLNFTRSSLVRARSVWAKFELFKIAAGLALLGMSLATCLTLRNAARRGIRSSLDVTDLASDVYTSTCLGAAGGATAGLLCKLFSIFFVPVGPLQAFSVLDSIISGAALGSQLSLNFSSKDGAFRSLALPSDGHGYIGMLLPFLHAVAFSSNSFTVHEDKIVLALVMVVIIYRGVQGFVASPTARLRLRIPALMAATALLLRLAAFSRICREEQAPDCRSTFYGAGDMSSNSPIAILFAYVLSFFLPTLIGYALGISRSFAGVAPLFINWLVRPALLAGAGFWLIDWLLTSNILGSELSPASQGALKWAKMALARADMMLIVVIGVAFWAFSPLCLELKRENPQAPGAPTTRLIVLGFANSLGSSYLLLLSLVTALLFLVAQSTGQIVLVLAFLVIVCCAEAGDGERDGRLLNEALAKAAIPGSPTVTFLEVATVALVGFVTFFATGHQATFASIQWRTAFVGFDTVVYPFSPLLVALNSFGPVALLPAMAVPLLVLWNLAPRPRRGASQQQQQQQQQGSAAQAAPEEERMPTLAVLLDASLSFILYHSIVTFSSALFAAHFKRHLMLFKIWTPRFMTGAVTLLVSHVGLIIGVLAAANIMSKVIITFGSRF
ncbi:hypothetical protein FA10DRAFT_219955, partial [Acaromyces ingoldii]